MPTAEKQIERTKREIELYQRALDISSIVAITDANGVITYANEYFCRISQYSVEELIGKTHKIINSGFHSPEFFSQMWKTISSGKIWKGEIKNRAKDGSFYWVDTTIMPFVEDDGKIKQYVSIRTDITLRKEAQEHKYRALFENTRDGLLIGRPDGTFLEVNSAFCDMLGYTYEEFMSLKRQDITIADDPELLEGMKQRSLTGFYRGPLKYRRKDGSLLHTEVSSVILKDEDGLDSTIVSIRDMTEKLKAEQALRDSERKFRALIENNKDGIALSNANWQINYLSPSIYTLLGYSPEELNTSIASQLVHPDDLAKNRQQMEDIIAGRIMHTSKQLRVYHKDGSLRWFHVTTSNHLADPAIGAMVTNFRDVTDTIKAAQELERLNQDLENKVEQRTQQLQEANKALEAFSYMAAHDLQSPLRIQSGYAEMLKDQYGSVLGDDGCGMLDTIISNTMQMRKLVTDLLSFSRINHVTLKKDAIDMSAMVKCISDTLLKNNLHPTEISIGDLGSSYCDPDLIRQVWTNLISNAVKYSGKNPKPQIEIGCMMQNTEKVYFVRDNGVGFDQAHAARLFMVFQRLHSDAEFQGSGVGLVIVNNIINRHHGKIWAEGEVDKGATFYFTLPE